MLRRQREERIHSAFNVLMYVVSVYYFVEVPLRMTFFAAPGLGNIPLEIVDLVLIFLCIADVVVRVKVLDYEWGTWTFCDAIAALPIGLLFRLGNTGNPILENGLVRIHLCPTPLYALSLPPLVGIHALASLAPQLLPYTSELHGAAPPRIELKDTFGSDFTQILHLSLPEITGSPRYPFPFPFCCCSGCSTSTHILSPVGNGVQFLWIPHCQRRSFDHLTPIPPHVLSFSLSPSHSIVASLLVIPPPSQLGIDLLKFFKLLRFSVYQSGIKKVLSSYNAALQRMALLSVQIIIGGSWLACLYFTVGGRLSLPLAVEMRTSLISTCFAASATLTLSIV